MIVYRNNFYGMPWHWGLRGSPIIRSLPVAALCALMGWLLERYASQTIEQAFHNPYPYQLYAYVVGFSLVFRCNLSYNRFWEARGALATMGSKWADVALQLRVFDEEGIRKLGAPAESDRDYDTSFAEHAVHLVSLMHAVALRSLRGDFLRPASGGWRPGVNLETDRGPQQTPPELDIMQNMQRKFKLASIMFLRETHSDWGGEVMAKNPFPVLGGLDAAEAELLFGEPGGEEQVAHVMEALLAQMARRGLNGGLAVAGPILSRTYQVLSDGHVGYSTARKIKDTPFPYAYAHTLFIMLAVFVFTLPCLAVAMLNDSWVVALLCFAASASYIALYETARELEDPYGIHSNDLPLCQLQHQFNRRIEPSRIGAQCREPTKPKPHFDSGIEEDTERDIFTPHISPLPTPSRISGSDSDLTEGRHVPSEHPLRTTPFPLYT